LLDTLVQIRSARSSWLEVKVNTDMSNSIEK
jgi:hypothetical protein